MTLWTYSVNPRLAKLADHWPYNSQNHSGQRHFPTLRSDILLCQEELAALCKFHWQKPCYRVIHPSHSPHGALVHLFARKTALFDFVSFPRPSTKFFQERPIPTSTLFRPPRCTMEKHESTPRSISCMHTTCTDFTWRQMEDCIPNPLCSLRVVGKCMKGLLMHPPLFKDLWMTSCDMIDVIVIIYLDDILIYSDNISEHKLHIWEVLCRLCTNRLFAMQTNAVPCHFLRIPSDICCHLKASPWPHTKFKSIPDGQFHEKSRIFNPYSDLPISTVFHLQIFQNHSSLMFLPARVHPGISLMSAILPLKHLKRLFTTAPVLTIGS